MLVFLAAVTVIMVACVAFTSADIFTSSLKIQKMLSEEGKLLETLKLFLDFQRERLDTLEKFYNHRKHEISWLQETSNTQNRIYDMEHPNGAFKIIRDFHLRYRRNLREYNELFLNLIENSSEMLQDEKVYFAKASDVKGAALSLLRLQKYYNLETTDMVRGDYLGHQGPALDAEEVYEIAADAFEESLLQQSENWLNACLEMCEGVKADSSCPKMGDILGLSGRISLANGDSKLAEIVYSKGLKFESYLGQMHKLSVELYKAKTKVLMQYEKEHTDYSYQLCSHQSKVFIENPFSPEVFCRYRRALLPYYRFKEEVLSVSPFISLFYDVITDAEGEHIKDVSQNKLRRGSVAGEGISDDRTGEVAWIDDEESPVVGNISLRIGNILGFETLSAASLKSMSSEPFQIVNYGIGGHFNVHLDVNANNVDIERLATFLIYLNDVTLGGSTVFTMTNITVSPVKNMALFWYNFDPAGDMDYSTVHAGCPVLIGQKWIANKWIWHGGNTFKRRCGLYYNSTDLDIEPDMFSNYGVTH